MGLAAVGYLLLAAWILSPLGTHPTTTILADSTSRGRSFGALWTYWWSQRRLGEWADPFTCSWVLPPEGARFGFDTHALLPTLLTAPALRFVGAVASYNLMTVLLLVGGALVLYGFLRRSERLSAWIAFPVGALFGGSPGFLATAHANPAWLGAAFWGGALGVLLHAFGRGEFGLRLGVPFAVALWGCFWTSFREFAVLVAGLAIAIPCLAWKPPLGRWRDRVGFLAPALLGVPSLLFLRHGPALREAAPLLDEHAIFGFLPLPASALILAVPCLLREWRSEAVRRRALISGLTVAVALDPGGGVQALLRSIPGRLVLERPDDLLPVARFLVVILAARGAALAWRTQRTWARVAVVGLALLWAFETQPAPIRTARVRRLESIVPGGRPDPRLRVLVVPDGPYREVDDTYQLAVEAPVVNHVFLERLLPDLRSRLAARFPRVYRDSSRTWDAEWGRELAALGVGYLVLPNPAMLGRLPPALRENVWMTGPDGVLVSLR